MFKNLIKGHPDKLCNAIDETSITVNTTLVCFSLGLKDIFPTMEEYNPVQG